MKTCAKCAEVKPCCGFYVYPHTGRLDKTCKACRRDYQRQRLKSQTGRAALDAWRQRRRVEIREDQRRQPCEHCGKMFDTMHERHDGLGRIYLLPRTNKRFCSSRCRARARPGYVANPEKARPGKLCDLCGLRGRHKCRIKADRKRNYLRAYMAAKLRASIASGLPPAVAEMRLLLLEVRSKSMMIQRVRKRSIQC